MNKLGVTKLVFSEYGSWMLGEGVDAGLLSEGDRVSLWKGEGEDAVKVAECSLVVQSGAMVLSGIQPQGGDIFLFKMESCAEPVPPSKASPEPPAPVQKAGKKRP